MDSRAILEEVRESIRVEDITEYEGLPAGPHVERSDAIIVVEGRADVLTLLRYGIKNAIAVEGTNVPDAVADLTRGKTVTAFLDGDRGGDLIRRELDQVGELDYIAITPAGKSVEDLSREEVHNALRDKVPAHAFEADQARAVGATGEDEEPVGESEELAEPGAGTPVQEEPAASGQQAVQVSESAEAGPTQAASSASEAVGETLADHIDAVESAGIVRLLDGDQDLLEEHDAADAFEVLLEANPAPQIVVLDGEVTQKLVDVASQRGIRTIVGAAEGEFVKQPTAVRIRTFDEY